MLVCTALGPVLHIHVLLHVVLPTCIVLVFAALVPGVLYGCRHLWCAVLMLVEDTRMTRSGVSLLMYLQ